MKRICEILGENLTVENLYKKAFSAGKNKYRNAWLKANGEGLKLFAEDMRKTVDKVNSKIRIGACSCISSWSCDGVSPFEISKIFAGNTKPFMRLIGAPYWTVNRQWGNRLQNIIELERMEASLNDGSVEIFAEGDVFPRPRFNCPSSYLELFDMAIRADEKQNGILKYTFDYTSGADYEKGYVEHHLQNKGIYDFIEKYFSDKICLGVRIYENIDKIKTMIFEENTDIPKVIDNSLFSPAFKIASDLSIPSVYNGVGISGVAFAENIEIVSQDAYKRGLIIDLAAAKILMKKGIDTGIEEILESVNPYEEHFIEDNDYIRVRYRGYNIKLNKKAEVSSEFIYKDKNGNNMSSPATYYYTNDKGQKFFVFACNAYYNDESLIRSYARSKQIKEAVERMSKEKLPCYSYGNPDLYLMCKEDNESKAIGLWNIFADSIISPVIQLDKEYFEIEFVNCNGKLKGNKVFLNEISAFSFAGIFVK